MKIYIWSECYLFLFDLQINSRNIYDLFLPPSHQLENDWTFFMFNNLPIVFSFSNLEISNSLFDVLKEVLINDSNYFYLELFWF